MEEEDKNQRAGFTIRFPPNSPKQLDEFNEQILRENSDDFSIRARQDNDGQTVVNYLGSSKLEGKAREVNHYAKDRLGGLYYKFWIPFHLDYYATAIMPKANGKINKM